MAGWNRSRRIVSRFCQSGLLVAHVRKRVRSRLHSDSRMCRHMWIKQLLKLLKVKSVKTTAIYALLYLNVVIRAHLSYFLHTLGPLLQTLRRVRQFDSAIFSKHFFDVLQSLRFEVQNTFFHQLGLRCNWVRQNLQLVTVLRLNSDLFQVR